VCVLASVAKGAKTSHHHHQFINSIEKRERESEREREKKI
jgi:hypothetical protein